MGSVHAVARRLARKMAALAGGWLLVFVFVPTSAVAQPGALDIAAWDVQADTLVPGQRGRVSFTAALFPGWRMYAPGSLPPTRPVAITFDPLPGVKVDAEPEHYGAVAGFDPVLQQDVVYFAEEARLIVGVVVDYPVPQLNGSITFMVCNDRICYPPTTKRFEVELATDGTVNATLRPVPQSAATSSARQFGGFWSFLLLAVGAGFGAFLMPCVYPMIPLTVSYFTRHANSAGDSIRMAVIFGLAIVATFTGLGILMAALVKGAGVQQIAANPWLNLFIGVTFIVLALSLLGLYELRLPGGMVNMVDRRVRGSASMMGVLFMGLSLTVVSFSCTVPFVGLLLPAIANGAWFYGIVGMLVFSMCFSLPFVLFAMFPRAMGSLPGAGSWMEVLKIIFGFVELAAAIKFLSNADIIWGLGLLSRPLAIALSTALFALAGLYLAGLVRLGDGNGNIGAGRLLGSTVFLGLALYLLPGLFGAPLGKLDAYLPPRQFGDMSLMAIGPASHDEGWIVDDIDQALAKARSVSKPVMVDFTGYTCTNCRDMEANVFPRPEIAQTLKNNFVLLRLYTDGAQDIELQQYQLDLAGTVALPTYVVLDPAIPEIPIVQASGVMKPGKFAEFLSSGAAMYFAKEAGG